MHNTRAIGLSNTFDYIYSYAYLARFRWDKKYRGPKGKCLSKSLSKIKTGQKVVKKAGRRAGKLASIMFSTIMTLIN